jgi:ribosomal protein L40E
MVACKNCGKKIRLGTTCPDCGPLGRDAASGSKKPALLTATLVDGKCTNCGTANAKDSLFCRKCFAFFPRRLATSEAAVALKADIPTKSEVKTPSLFVRATIFNGRCSNCGTANPKDSLFCSGCSAFFPRPLTTSKAATTAAAPKANTPTTSDAKKPALLTAMLFGGKCTNCGTTNPKDSVICRKCFAFFFRPLAPPKAATTAAAPKANTPTTSDAKKPLDSPLNIALAKFSRSIRRKCAACGTENGNFDFICKKCGSVLTFKTDPTPQAATPPSTPKQRPESEQTKRRDRSPTATASRALRVFLCHCSEDKPQVHRLYKRLKAGGLAPWYDEEDILPGQDWDLAIRQALRSCDIVLVCLSARAVSKVGYIQREISNVLEIASEQPEGSIFLIPARLENCNVPDRLSKFQWVDLFTDTGYQRLMRALDTARPRSS